MCGDKQPRKQPNALSCFYPYSHLLHKGLELVATNKQTNKPPPPHQKKKKNKKERISLLTHITNLYSVRVSAEDSVPVHCSIQSASFSLGGCVGVPQVSMRGSGNACQDILVKSVMVKTRGFMFNCVHICSERISKHGKSVCTPPITASTGTVHTPTDQTMGCLALILDRYETVHCNAPLAGCNM